MRVALRLLVALAVPLGALELQLEALSAAPHLEADLDGAEHVRFLVPSSAAETASRGARRVVLTNTQPYAQRFTVHASAPFEVTGIDVALERFLHRSAGTATKGVFDVELPPRECADIALKYNAPAVAAEEDQRVDSEIEGALVVKFAGSGAVQKLPLRASFMHPELRAVVGATVGVAVVVVVGVVVDGGWVLWLSLIHI